jgi:hypothetical protein
MGLGVQIWEKVAPLFNHAKVETKVDFSSFATFFTK